MAICFILVIFLMLVLVGKARYFLALLLRQEILGLHVVKDYTHQPTVSVLIPCYNEGEAVYGTIVSACRSNYPSEKLEVVVVDDCSTDDSYEWMLKAQVEFPDNVIIGRNTVNSKKPQTICNAFEKSKGEIIIEVDSDCILDRNAIREVCACFAEKTLGGCGAVVNVKNSDKNILTVSQSLAYFMQFHFLKPLENWSRTVSCISGAMLAIRRELLAKFDPMIRCRKWLGIPVNEGEDRFLTQLILLEGYGTYVDLQAHVYTDVPDNWTKLFKQQLRWYRGSIRIFFSMLWKAPRHIHKLHPNALYSLFASGLASLTTLALIFANLINGNGNAFWLAPALLIGVTGFVAIFDGITRIWFPTQVVKHPLKMILYGVWWVCSLLLTVAAIGTLDLGADWGTRSKPKLGE